VDGSFEVGELGTYSKLLGYSFGIGMEIFLGGDYGFLFYFGEGPAFSSLVLEILIPAIHISVFIFVF